MKRENQPSFLPARFLCLCVFFVANAAESVRPGPPSRSENLQRLGALQHQPDGAAGEGEPAGGAPEALPAEAAVMLVGPGGGDAAALGDEADELGVADRVPPDASVVHPAHADGRTTEKMEKRANHVELPHA